ncbi:unconventional myosin-XIX-like isoform X1 [Sinocyclocheilus anshuiensis]|uniref:unconventional myosin-XIX-like isoform X1 n=2 Tax=Sinocyclocheilus anshuiensis TaxID=1608454 RepID=UPI0007BA2589|nr:PREDICTED: unconventional myosin-XIX-like isoform X1 [Sinocyclocheilus anshuiensis]
MANVKQKLLFRNKDVSTVNSSEGTFRSLEKAGRPNRQKEKVHGLKDRTQDLRKSLNDSLEGDIRDFLINEAELHTYDDLTKVNPVTPSTVLKCLQARYSAKVFYTHAGCTLVALNPFQPIPHLYSLDVMREYHSAPQPQEFKPHIFIVAEEAYRNVQGQVEPMNQSLVVSGESGAGKTWTSRCLMKYYATVATSSQKCQDTVEKIERRVLDSNPVMEAFGNACTLRNSNSSRFGKYIQLQLNGSQLLVGASVQTYLLEKTRVAFQAPNERNFHIFYLMMKGATEKQRLEWMLPLEQDFAWLPHAEKTLEEDCLQEMVEAMINLGIDEGKRTQIFRILAGLLQLGNVDFSPASEEAQPCDLDGHSKGFLQKTADLLQVPLDELQSCLTVRTLRAGKQSVLKPCTQSECGVRRDCLAKVIYAQLFDWLVTFINNSMCADNPTWCNFIGLLDVYGFECFLLNNLEQLCINYANEKLQQHFVAHYLKAQQEEYVTEGLQWSFIRYQDNQGCLDLIEGSPSSIFSLLNEECRLNRASDAKQFRVRLQKELSDNASISWDKLSKEPHFTVAHYADKVSYQIEGMMEKNKDPVPPEIISLLQKSQDSLLHSLFADGDRESEGSRGHSKVVTVVSKFKNSLESLMKILHSTTPHYTRCIKPNPDCRPLTFKKEEVIAQLEACGIVETINISAAGFPIRIPYGSFFQRYGLIANARLTAQMNRANSPEMSDQAVLGSAVEDVLNVVFKRRAPNNNNMVHCGRTKVFLTHSLLEMLEEHRNRVRSQKVFCIQCCWRRYQTRQRNLRTQAATRLQAGVRSWLVRREIKKWHKAASVIQTKWRRWRAWMDALAEAELDDAEDFMENEASSVLPKLLKERGSVQLSSIQEPVMVRGWPIGLAMASAPSITVSLTATGFQRIMSMMACLKIPFRHGEYKVKTNQFDQGVASIRAQPRGSIKMHLQRSPLLYADMHPVHKTDVVTGLNQILLERT